LVFAGIYGVKLLASTTRRQGSQAPGVFVEIDRLRYRRRSYRHRLPAGQTGLKFPHFGKVAATFSICGRPRC